MQWHVVCRDVRLASPRLGKVCFAPVKFSGELVVNDFNIRGTDTFEYVCVLGVEAFGGAVIVNVATELRICEKMLRRRCWLYIVQTFLLSVGLLALSSNVSTTKLFLKHHSIHLLIRYFCWVSYDKGVG